LPLLFPALHQPFSGAFEAVTKPRLIAFEVTTILNGAPVGEALADDPTTMDAAGPIEPAYGRCDAYRIYPIYPSSPRTLQPQRLGAP
jgi:hypothetical protein